MKSGVVGIELELTLSFHPDGTLSGMRSIAAEGVALPEKLAADLWNYLRDLKPADALIEAAWYDAEQGDRDDAAREARRPLSHGEVEANRNRDEIEDD